MNHVKFRFYEELNNYLPEGNRKIWFDFYFIGIQTLKEVFQSMEVPAKEIDLILVNQQSQGFDYLLRDGDRISVYPVFELFDISKISRIREKPLRNPAFICDVHLGRLSKYLRMLGFDAQYSNRFSPDDLIARSNSEKRILLSKSLRLIHHKEVTRSYRIRSADPVEQIKDIVGKLDLSGLANPFSRCLNCNHKLQEVEKPEIIDRLQPLTRKHFQTFLRCPSCDRIYWEGSHFERMQEIIALHQLARDYDPNSFNA